MSDNYDYLFKCVAVGDGGCGKTAIVVRFSQGFFKENYKLTIGVEFAVKSIKINNHNVKLQIWDTGGQERFQYVRPLYYKGSMGCIILFDLTNRESFDHIPKWMQEVRKESGDIPMLLVGNKSDLVDQRKISREEAEELAQDFNMFYIESSAKNGDGVSDIFGILALLMIGEDIPSKMLNRENFSSINEQKKKKSLMSESNLEKNNENILENQLNSSKPESVFSVNDNTNQNFNSPFINKPKPISIFSSKSSLSEKQYSNEKIKPAPIDISLQKSDLLLNNSDNPQENAVSDILDSNLDDMLEEPDWFAPKVESKDIVHEKIKNESEIQVQKSDIIKKKEIKYVNSEKFIPEVPPKPSIEKKKEFISHNGKFSNNSISNEEKKEKNSQDFKKDNIFKKENLIIQPIGKKKEINPFFNTNMNRSNDESSNPFILSPKLKVNSKNKSDINPFLKSSPIDTKPKIINKSINPFIPTSNPIDDKKEHKHHHKKKKELNDLPDLFSNIHSNYSSNSTSDENKQKPSFGFMSESPKNPKKSFLDTTRKKTLKNPFSDSSKKSQPNSEYIPSFLKADINNDDQNNTCSNCGAILNKKFKFCNKCGNRI